MHDSESAQSQSHRVRPVAAMGPGIAGSEAADCNQNVR
jgi:hypothetical protein